MTSLELVTFALVIAALIGIPLGVLAARWKGRPPDWIAGISASLLASVPIFWLGLLLQLLIATELHWLPVAGRWDRTLNAAAVAATRTHMVLVDSLLAGNLTLFVSGFSHLLMPAVVIAAYPIGLFARLTRAGLLIAGIAGAAAGRPYGVAASSIRIQHIRVCLVGCKVAWTHGTRDLV